MGVCHVKRNDKNLVRCSLINVMFPCLSCFSIVFFMCSCHHFATSVVWRGLELRILKSGMVCSVCKGYGSGCRFRVQGDLRPS